jgi:hypothetical protein
VRLQLGLRLGDFLMAMRIKMAGSGCFVVEVDNPTKTSKTPK